jgi:hypothetical protein
MPRNRETDSLIVFQHPVLSISKKSVTTKCGEAKICVNLWIEKSDSSFNEYVPTSASTSSHPLAFIF